MVRIELEHKSEIDKADFSEIDDPSRAMAATCGCGGGGGGAARGGGTLRLHGPRLTSAVASRTNRHQPSVVCRLPSATRRPPSAFCRPSAGRSVQSSLVQRPITRRSGAAAARITRVPFISVLARRRAAAGSGAGAAHSGADDGHGAVTRWRVRPSHHLRPPAVAAFPGRRGQTLTRLPSVQ